MIVFAIHKYMKDKKEPNENGSLTGGRHLGWQGQNKPLTTNSIPYKHKQFHKISTSEELTPRP